MKNQNKLEQKRSKLDLRKDIADISSSSEFVEIRNEPPLDGETMQDKRLRAISTASLAVSQRYPDFSFEHNKLKTYSKLDSFYNSQKYLDNFRQTKKSNPNKRPTEEELDQFYDAKDEITNFNHTLRETIESAGNEGITFTELLRLMTQQYMSISQKRDVKDFHDMAKDAIVGMRNEIATEMILIKNGVDFDQGTEEEDAHGGDFIINNTLVDIKSSEETAMRARSRAINNGYDASGIVWSGIKNTDFGDGLLLDSETEEKVSRHLIPAIDNACGTNYSKAA